MPKPQGDPDEREYRSVTIFAYEGFVFPPPVDTVGIHASQILYEKGILPTIRPCPPAATRFNKVKI